MDFNRIIGEGTLIYASRPEDGEFKRWRLNKTVCKIAFYNTYALTKLDRIILLTLEYNEDKLYEDQLATILGFNVKDDFESTPKRYKDEGEIGIFQGILQELKVCGLIVCEDHIVRLSDLGKLVYILFHTDPQLLSC